VITQPDKPKGRGLHNSMSAVKELALRSEIPVHQPEKIKDASAIGMIKDVDADLIVVVAYGKILPKEIIFAKKYGTINVHASLLPKYRGAAPIQRAILNGDKVTGMTIQHVAENLDSGDIILQQSVEISNDDTTTTLTEKLFDVGAKMLVDTVQILEKGRIKQTKQDETKMTYAHMLKKEDGLIDWTRTSSQILDQIRACNPWPIAYTISRGKMLKIFSAQAGFAEKVTPGTVAEVVSGSGFIVGTGDGSLLIKEVQLEGSKRMKAWDFIQGHRLVPTDRFPS
jgi:methionyl-tRNA formyltransferase